MLAGMDCEMGSLCLVKLHCMLTKPSCGMLKGLREVFQVLSGEQGIFLIQNYSFSVFAFHTPFFLVIPSLPLPTEDHANNQFSFSVWNN